MTDKRHQIFRLIPQYITIHTDSQLYVFTNIGIFHKPASKKPSVNFDRIYIFYT